MSSFWIKFFSWIKILNFLFDISSYIVRHWLFSKLFFKNFFRKLKHFLMTWTKFRKCPGGYQVSVSQYNYSCYFKNLVFFLRLLCRMKLKCLLLIFCMNRTLSISINYWKYFLEIFFENVIANLFFQFLTVLRQ